MTDLDFDPLDDLHLYENINTFLKSRPGGTTEEIYRGIQRKCHPSMTMRVLDYAIRQMFVNKQLRRRKNAKKVFEYRLAEYWPQWGRQYFKFKPTTTRYVPRTECIVTQYKQTSKVYQFDRLISKVRG